MLGLILILVSTSADTFTDQPLECFQLESASDFTDTLKYSDGRGVVEVALLVGADGKAMGVKVRKSSGHARLDKAAEADLSRCLIKSSATGSIVRVRYIVDVWKKSTHIEVLPNN